MSMTELERHLLNCLEGLQQEFTSSQKSQNNRLASLEERLGEQERNLDQLTMLFKGLVLLLQRLNNVIENM